ncbi:phage protein [Burkholderia gladioli]|uniref:phage protein n=1 Tax=Burkholderia gladioli TaxID=28095 RepID=UPI003D1A3489
MTAQFGRKISLIIGPDSGNALDLSALRIVFHVRRGDTQTPNSLRVRVYNVSDNTSQSAESKEFTRVVLQAGYEGSYGIIFDGSIVQVRRGRESATDTYLDITAADGDMAYNFAFVNTTLAAGATQSDIVNACIRSMATYGVTAGYIPDLPNNPLPRGRVLFGLARDHLEVVARTTQTLWSIQDGKLQIVPETSYVPGDIPVIDRKSGMVGMPEQTQNGIKVRMLLNPSIKIGRLIQLDNSSIQKFEFGLSVSDQPNNYFAATQNKINGDGFYYVMDLGMWGDTRGNDWYTEVICLSVDVTADIGLANKAGGASAPAPAKLGVIKPYS